MSNNKTWLEMQKEDSFPTNFALSIAKAVDIIETDDPHGSLGVKIMDQELRMRHFQQMAIACSFEESLIAYHGESFNEAQMEALQVIYKSTKPWMLGAVIGNLMDRLNNPKITNKDFALTVVTILDQLNETDGKGITKATETMKGLTFELAHLPEKK